MKKILLALLILSSVPFAAAQDIAFQPGHVHAILAVRFSPDDSQLISFSGSDRSEDDRLCLWDVRSGRLLWMTATGFVQRRYEYCNLKEFFWSEDGQFIVTKSMNGTCQTWDAKTGKIVALGETEPDIRLASPHKKELVVSEDYTHITIRDPETGRAKLFKRFGFINAFGRSFEISNGGTMLAEPGNREDTSIRITDIKTGGTWWLDAHPSVVRAIAFSPDGTVVAVAGTDKTIYLFNVAKRVLANTLVGHTTPVFSLSFSPDGHRLLSCSTAAEAKLWDWENGRLIQEAVLGGDVQEDWKVSISPDGNSVLAGCGEIRDGGTVFGLWDAQTLKPIRTFRVNEKYQTMTGNMDSVPVRDAVFVRDGKEIMAAYADDTLRIWDAKSGRMVKRFRTEKDISGVLPGPGERTILAIIERGPLSARADNSRIKLLSSETGRKITSFDDLDTDYIETLAVSPDGRYLAVSHDEAAVLLRAWDGSRQLLSLDVGSSGFDALAFSPDSRTLAVGGVNQNLQFFDVETGTKLWQLIPFYQPSELEARLAKERIERQSLMDEARARRDRQAVIDTEEYKNQVYISFQHYGEMIDPWMLRFSETGELNKSKVVTTAKDANAIWLCLHNDSPLPIKIETGVPYLEATKCIHEFSKGNVIYGLCPDKEISLRLDLENKDGKTLPRMYDNSFVVILLPKTSVLFAVQKELLEHGNRIKLDFSFQNVIEKDSYWTLTESHADYGTIRTLEFSLAGLPKSRKSRPPAP